MSGDLIKAIQKLIALLDNEHKFKQTPKKKQGKMLKKAKKPNKKRYRLKAL
jgi:hypothetical protein